MSFFVNFIYDTKNKDKLVSFLVTVKKLHQICLKFEHKSIQSYIVYNGPGIFSKPLKSQQIQKTSAFQCLIHTSTKHVLQMDHRSIHTLQYISQLSPVSQSVKIYKNGNILIRIPNKNCFDAVCILNIESQSRNQINATVTKMTTSEKAPNSSVDLPCAFSGLVATEIFPDDSRESATYCKSHDSSSHPSRCFYSHNSSLILLAYWFEPYSVINITLNISESKCKLIQIDSCTYDEKCMSDFKSSNCQSYLDYITNFVPINVSKDGHFIFTHMTDEECVVLVLSSNTHDMLTHSIQIKLNKVQIFSIKVSIKGCASLIGQEDITSKHYLSKRSLLAIVTCDLNEQNEPGALSEKVALSQDFILEALFSCWTEIILRKPQVIYKKIVSAFSTRHCFPPGTIHQAVCCVTPFLF